MASRGARWTCDPVILSRVPGGRISLNVVKSPAVMRRRENVRTVTAVTNMPHGFQITSSELYDGLSEFDVELSLFLADARA